MAKTEKHEAAWQNPWVWLLVGIMAVTLLVNGTLITVAFTSPPGLVVADYYDKGKSYLYDQAKEEQAAQRLGWNLILDLPKVPSINQRESYLVRAVDRDGQPIIGAMAEFAAFRPVENGHDFVVSMQDMGAGYYAADVDFSLPGNWDLIVTVRQGEDQLDIAKRIFVNK
jgi:nitrogen fixation protein FixH